MEQTFFNLMNLEKIITLILSIDISILILHHLFFYCFFKNQYIKVISKFKIDFKNNLSFFIKYLIIILFIKIFFVFFKNINLNYDFKKWVITIFYIILFLLFLPFLIEIKKYYTKMLRALKELGEKNEKKTFK